MTVLAEAHPPISRRGPGLGSSVNDRLLDAILRHRHFVLRIENSVARDLIRPLREARASILAELTKLAARDGALSNFANFHRSSLIAMERRIREALLFAEAQAISVGAERFREFAGREIAFQNRLLRSTTPGAIALDLLGPSPGQIEALLLEPLGGTRWASRMHQRYGETLVGMRNAIGASVLLGEGMPQAATRIQAVAKVTRRQAVVLARSEIQRVANSAATASYMRNQDVIKGLVHVATFDSRTCLICGGLDGTFYAMGESLPQIPVHAQCRCFRSPVLRSFEEMGMDTREIPASTRASMDGQVPASLTYEDWFATQSDAFQLDVLGPSRFERFQNGDLAITSFVRDLQVLRINELPIPRLK